MAGAGFKDFEAGEKLFAVDVNGYLMDQSVMRFASSSARGSAIGTAVSEGMVSYLNDTNTVEVYNGSAWVGLESTLNDGTQGFTALSNGTAGISYQPVSHNYVINGAMEVDQRTGPHTFGARKYTLDRWVAARAGSVAGATITKVSSSLANIPSALKMQRDNGNTSTAEISLQQNFETAGLELAGKQISFSFFARAGADFSGRLTPRIQTSTSTPASQGYTSTGRFDSGTVDLASNIFSPSTDWTRYTYTLTLSSNANAMQIELSRNSIVGTAGADDWIEITGVQLEAGSVATPFKRHAPSLQGELAACMRYFQVVADGATSTSERLGIAYMESATEVRSQYRFPLPMRATPTFSATSGTNFYSFDRAGSSDTLNSLTGIATTIRAIELNNTTNVSGTTGQVGRLRLANAAAKITLDAEI